MKQGFFERLKTDFLSPNKRIVHEKNMKLEAATNVKLQKPSPIFLRAIERAGDYHIVHLL
jgi:hypothetical protein